MNTADIQTSHKITSVLWKRRKKICHQFRSVQSLSHFWLFATLYSMPGFIVHHHSKSLLRLVQWVDDAIQPTHPLSSPSPPAFSLSQHQRLFWFWEESVLHLRWSKYWSFSLTITPYIQDWFPLWLTGLISSQSNGLSRVFSNTTVQKHQFFGSQLSLWSNSDFCTWVLGKP